MLELCQVDFKMENYLEVVENNRWYNRIWIKDYKSWLKFSKKKS
jgi:hypothetical protein